MIRHWVGQRRKPTCLLILTTFTPLTSRQTWTVPAGTGPFERRTEGPGCLEIHLDAADDWISLSRARSASIGHP